ncbi:uncharacterized protein GGS25DRAFT_186453 [Hypoxylon fragiforme]|uniref:uncharacterized protein n=1 Tax=Hypoxylon fragiforme TaxID=63214 RepID=UPI0020C677E0|nr:uncharacterized protein GGS25DRAFT_186453 [Hypoxylon fragiforme]KAI2611220.1 hypothetical protein GGS25DRAFT_186453 [Hypoxylon fragiforme]
MSANCTIAPDAVPSDAGVAGIGVLLSFIITAGIALIISASLIIEETRSRRAHKTSPQKPSTLRRKLLNSYSDQQILTGIGIQGVGLAKADTLIPYHFFLVWMLSLLSMAVHNATLLALARDFRRDWVLRWMRQALMFANLVLSCVYGVCVLRAVMRGLNDTTYPIACVWRADAAGAGHASSNSGVSFAGTIAVIAGNVVVFLFATWYLHARRLPRFYAAFQAAGLLLMTASAVGATVRVAYLADAFAQPPITLLDPGEQLWSFGQLLSVGMLLLPLVSVVEILRGDIKCAPPVPQEYYEGEDSGGDDGALLGAKRGQELRGGSAMGIGPQADFQPNPFWGSQTTFFKKEASSR